MKQINLALNRVELEILMDAMKLYLWEILRAFPLPQFYKDVKDLAYKLEVYA